MVASYSTLLILLCLIQVKHMLADYFLQTKSMLEGRGQYLHLGTFVHAGIHAAGSFIALSLVGAPVSFVVPVVLLEWAVHFHIDWWKGRHTTHQKLTPSDSGYWRASGVDQALHQLTYIGMIWLWLMSQGSA